MTRRKRVFYVAHLAASNQWWAGWGSRQAGRMTIPVLRTLFSSPPVSFAACVVIKSRLSPEVAMTLHTPLAAPKVTIYNGKAVTTSQDVADYFGKLHKDVLKKIDSLDCSPTFTSANFCADVQKVDIGNDATRDSKIFTMTKDGFVFLVMGFTGKKAAAFKEAYIAEFNRMEAELYAMPRHNSSAAELFTDDDLRRLTHLVWSMSNGFRFEKAWTQGIWHALRLVTGVPSPQHFEVRQIPY
ncbi:Rha family transcriptional regulator [Sodalis glossinidius]|uniref:Rha family transcriptional regulator n=1 Tax=Sodalis glossinidius TaxID=63612 RepID=UPI003C760C3C